MIIRKASRSGRGGNKELCIVSMVQLIIKKKLAILLLKHYLCGIYCFFSKRNHLSCLSVDKKEVILIFKSSVTIKEVKVHHNCFPFCLVTLPVLQGNIDAHETGFISPSRLKLTSRTITKPGETFAQV